MLDNKRPPGSDRSNAAGRWQTTGARRSIFTRRLSVEALNGASVQETLVRMEIQLTALATTMQHHVQTTAAAHFRIEEELANLRRQIPTHGTVVHDCTVLQEHSCMAEGLHGCASESLHACTPARLHACTPANSCTLARLHACKRLHTCTPARLHVCTSARLHGCTAARLPYTAVRLHGSTAQEHHDHYH